MGGLFMKKLIIAAAAVLISAPAMAGGLVGTWQTTPDDNGNYGNIEVSKCGNKYCGILVKSFNPDGSELKSPNVGKKIIWDMEDQGNGAYGNGKIWSPDRDKTYKSKMKLNGNTLSIKGCISFICRDGGTWTHVN
jgi:uncharacterized protein (DUF2147 family)